MHYNYLLDPICELTQPNSFWPENVPTQVLPARILSALVHPLVYDHETQPPSRFIRRHQLHRRILTAQFQGYLEPLGGHRAEEVG